jgi:hypothetical protein
MTPKFGTYRERRILKLQPRVVTNRGLLSLASVSVSKFVVHDGTGEAKGYPVWSLSRR